MEMGKQFFIAMEKFLDEKKGNNKKKIPRYLPKF
jgi:hypothetical protein